ncbi:MULTISPECIES: hypothetical protein [Paenibacillus]|uniref:hypothetical protein n=1 Tax=Paenibacillus TaxID=44249 RepID=UPI001BD04869|nr:hypothetical protein [Paenibacillus dendritiformis]
MRSRSAAFGQRTAFQDACKLGGEVEASARLGTGYPSYGKPLAAANAPPSPNAGTVDSGSPSRTRPSRASDVELKGGSHRLCSRTSASSREQLKLWKEGFNSARNESWHQCDHDQLPAAKGPRSRTPASLATSARLGTGYPSYGKPWPLPAPLLLLMPGL